MEKKSQRDRHQNKGFTLFVIVLCLCVSNVRLKYTKFMLWSMYLQQIKYFPTPLRSPSRSVMITFHWLSSSNN